MMVLPFRVAAAKLALGAAIALAIAAVVPGARAEDVTKAYTVSGRFGSCRMCTVRRESFGIPLNLVQLAPPSEL